MRPHKIIVELQQLQMFLESSFFSRMAGCPSAQIGRPLTDGQIVPFDEGGVQLRGVFRMQECVFHLCGCSTHNPAANGDDPFLSSRLDDLPIDTDAGHESLHSPAIEVKAIGREKKPTEDTAPLEHIEKASLYILIASASHSQSNPKP